MDFKSILGNICKNINSEEGAQTLFDISNILRSETEELFFKSANSKLEKIIKLGKALEIFDGIIINNATNWLDKNVLDKKLGDDWYVKYFHVRENIAHTLEIIGQEIIEKIKEKKFSR